MVIIDNVIEDTEARIKQFFDCFIDMEDGADIDISGGVGHAEGEAPEPTIVIQLSKTQFPFTTDQARVIAQIAESTMTHHPRLANASFPDLIMGLRYAADEADRIFVEGEGR